MSAAETHVAVIGGGVVGCAVAHALARRGVPATLLEAAPALGLGASAANSGILHTGFDSTPGELETRLILRAGELRAELLGELRLPVWRCGALLRPREDAQRVAVAELAENARRNGVQGDLLADGSLAVPGESVTDPLAFLAALAAGAAAGGADVRLEARVSALAGDGGAVRVSLAGGAVLNARAAVNCAGLHADRVAALAGDHGFEIYPRKGEFLVFRRSSDCLLEQVLLPVPSSLGKGVLVFPTLDRRFLVAGPTAREREDKDDWSVEADAHELVLGAATSMLPALARAERVGSYAGLRPAGRDANYVIERSAVLPGLIHVAAIRSTGLSACLAIGEHVVGLLAADGAIEPGEERPLALAAPPAVPRPWWRWASEERAAGRARAGG
jgi:glycerol-3-phosphate dehydrogenase